MGSGASSPLDEAKLPILQLASLEGQWAIVRTTLPLWLKGDRLHPTLNYAVLGPTKLSDCVRYRSKSSSSESEIVGVNTQQGPVGSANMQWRGSGALCWVTSDWAVVHMAEVRISTGSQSSGTAEAAAAEGRTQDAAVGVIYFSKTMFTPEGIDVIVRVPPPVSQRSSTRSAASPTRPTPAAKDLLALMPDGTLERVEQDAVAAHPNLSRLVASLRFLPES